MFVQALGEALFPLSGLKVFGFELHAFGFLVGTGIIAGTILAQKRAKQLGLSESVVAEVALWAVIPGFIGAHLVHQLLYFPHELWDHSESGIITLARDSRAMLSYVLPNATTGAMEWFTVMRGEPLRILEIWHGISSFGGFLGGTFGVVWYFKRRRKELPFLPYADAIMFGFCFAWIFGRMGCTTAFDHPGSPTDFFLGMEYGGGATDRAGHPLHGVVIHNLGFYEMMWTCLMFVVFWLNRKRTHFKGWYLAMFIVMYMPIRFFWDFLREVDVHYAGLTPGQWIAIVLFSCGIAIIYLGNKNHDMLAPDGTPKPQYWPAKRAIAGAAAGGGSVATSEAVTASGGIDGGGGGGRRGKKKKG